MQKKTVVGVDIGGSKVRAGLVDRGGNLLSSCQVSSSFDDGADVVIDRVVGLVEGLLAANAWAEVLGVGVAAAGQVDPRSGTITGVCHPSLDWAGTEVGRLLSEKLGMPVRVENDANAVALAELHHGAARGCDCILCLTIGTGIGGAAVVDGRLYHGFSATGGGVRAHIH